MPIPSPTEFLQESPDIDSLVGDASQRHGVDPDLVHSVIKQESAGNPKAVSPKGAVGLMQLMPNTAKDLGVDPHDPGQNIEGGVKLLKRLQDKYGGDTQKALAAYNAGEGAVDKAGGVPNFPETQDYVKRVGSDYQARTAGKPATVFPGLITPGNIDLKNRPVVKNPDGSSSTVKTITIEQDGKGILLPTIIDGKPVSDEEAIKHFEKTGEHMGMFKSEADADAYDKDLHNRMGWNGAPGSSQAAWQSTAPGAAVAAQSSHPLAAHGIPSPSEFLDDPLNAQPQNGSQLPTQEEYDRSHQTFLQRARATFQQGLDAGVQKLKSVVADPSQLIPAPIAALPGMVHDSAAGPLIDKVNEHGLIRPLQDALRPPVQYDEPKPTTAVGKAAQGVGEGLTRSAESLTTPANLALLVGTEGVGMIPKIGSMLPRGVSIYFGARMFKDAYDKIPAVREAIHKGDIKGAAQAITEGVAAGVLGSMAAYHAAGGEVSRGTGKSEQTPAAGQTRSEQTPATGQTPDIRNAHANKSFGKNYDELSPADQAKIDGLAGMPPKPAGGPGGVSKVPTPSEFLSGLAPGPKMEGEPFLKQKAGGAEPTTPAKESAKVFDQHGKTYAELFEDLNDKDKQKAASEAGAANRPPKAAIPQEGTPEGVARALDARERLAQKLTGQPFNKLNNPDRMAVDELITEGFGQAAEPKKGFRAGELDGAGPDLLAGSGPADVVRMPRPKAADQPSNTRTGEAEPVSFQQGSARLPANTGGPRGTEAEPLVTEVARPGTEAPDQNVAREVQQRSDAAATRRADRGVADWENVRGANALKPDVAPDEGGRHVAQLVDRTQTLKPEIAEKLAPGSTRVNAKGGVETLTEVPLDKIKPAAPTPERPEGNVIYPDVVEKYKANPSPVAPELRANDAGGFDTYEGHHRIEAAKARGEKSILAWTSKAGPDGFPEVPNKRPNFSVESGKFIVHEETGAPAMRVPLDNPDSVKGASFLLRHMGEDKLADELETAGGLKSEGKSGSSEKPANKEVTDNARVTPERQPVNDKAANEPRGESEYGKPVSIRIPGSPATYKARYAIREAGDVHASHNAFSFGRNPEFEHANDRDYESAGNAARVVEQAQKFDPEFMTTESPTAEHGGPIVDKRGNVLGGNSRKMTLDRVYDEGGEHADAYRKALTDKAEALGIKPAELAKFKQPVLVRELSGAHDPQKAITDFNKKGPAELSPEERAVSDGRRLSPETVQEIAARLGESEEGGTLADALRGEEGASLVNQLVKDGVVTKQEANGMIDDRGHLTAEAKSRIAKALVGRLFNTPAEFRNAKPEMRAKLERIAPQVLRVEGRKGWAITKQIREAIVIAEEARAHKSNVDDLVNQVEIGGKKREYSPEGKQLAETLLENPRNAEYAFRRYANDEQLSRPGAQKPMFEPPTREQAFRDAFGDGLSAEADHPKGWESAPGRDDLKGGPGRVPKLESHPLALDQGDFVGGMSDKFHGEHAVLKPVELTRAEREGSDAFVLNVHAMEWLARAATGARDSVPRTTSGLHIATDQLGSLARNMERKIEKTFPREGLLDTVPASVEYLLNSVKAAHAAGKSLIFINGHPAFTMYNEGTLEHELAHAVQSRVGGRSSDHLGSHQDYFLDHPLAKRAINALTASRYPGANRGSLAMEIGVRLMTAGHENVGPAWQELGLKAQEARDLSAVYLRSLRKEYGNAAPREIAKQVFAHAPGRFEESEADYGERPPRVGREGGDRPPGGAGPDVPGNEGKPATAAGDRAQGAGARDNGDDGEGRRAGLFGEEGDAISRANQRDADALTKKRLEAQLAAPITREEQLKSLKRDKTKRQGGLFDGPADESQQSSLFDASIIGAREREPGDKFSDWRKRMEEHVGKLNTGVAVKLYAAAGKLVDNTSGKLDYKAIAEKFREGLPFKSMYDSLKPLGSRVAAEGDGAGASLMKLVARAGDKGEVNAGRMLVKLSDVKVNDLTRPQRIELLDHLEGRAKSDDPRVLEVGKVMRGITDELAGQAAATGVEIRTKNGRRPFAKLDDYFPHILRNAEALSSGPVRRDVIDNIVRQGIKPDAKEAGAFVDDWVKYLQSGKRADSVLQHLVDTGQAHDKAEALAKLQRFRSNIQRHGSLEYARELNLPFYDPDPVRVIPFAAATGAKRLAQIAEFGQDHQRINQEILKIAEHGGNADFARKSIDKILGIVTDGDTPEARVSRFLRAAETMKLGLSALPNATQGVLNSMLAADAPTVALGFRDALTKRGRRLAIESGAAIEPVLAEAHKELGGGRMVDKYLKYTGFSQTEQFNRATAANVGARWAKKQLEELIASPADPAARKRLDELGIDADKAIERGSLTQEDRLMAAKKFSDLTQFRTRPEDLPAFASTPIGRVAFQFKSFAYNQALLIAKETAGEIKEGRIGRGLRTAFVVATLFPAAGELVRILRNAITGRQQDFEDEFAHYFGALSSAGTLGILQDAFSAASNKKTLNFIAGPAAGDIAQIGDILGDSNLDAEDKAAALQKFAIQKYAGPARRLFPDQ